jgi:uncharacterized protein (DUF1778 family)
MLLGGVAIDDRLVRRLAAILDRRLGNKLDHALLFRAQIVALTREEKEAILAALEKAPPDLEPVRELLAAEAQWRVRRRL